MNTVLARVPHRSTKVISPATANAGRADGSPVDGAAQRGRADVGRSVLPLASAPSLARWSAGAAAVAGESQRGRAEVGRLPALAASSFLSSITSVLTVSPAPAMSSGGTAGAAAASPQRRRPLSAASGLSFGSP